jgi:hypothetical protein
MAIVEIEETGELLCREVICNDVDLVDPTGTRPEIGDYVPNIVYINRETNEKASGGGGGGGGRGSMTNIEDEDLKWYTEFIKNKNQIGMVIRKKNGTDYIDAAAIALSINEWDESTTAYINADHVNISATNTAHLLAGSIVYDASGNLVLEESSGGGIMVKHNKTGDTATFGIWDRGNLTGGVMVEQINGQTAVKISGNVIDINGSQITISADRIDINGIVSKLLTEQIACVSIHTTGGSNLFEGHCSFPDTVSMQDLTYQNSAVNWKSTSVTTSISHGSTGRKTWALDGGSTWEGSMTTWVTANNTTISYLG